MSTARTADAAANAADDSTADRAAALALLAGSLLGLGVMALHPTGRDAVRNAAAGAPNTLLAAVHTLALLVQPLLLAGTLALTRRLRSGRSAGGTATMAGAAAVGATVYFAFASAAALVAAAASGLIAPSVLQGFDTGDASSRAAMLAALDYTGRLNRSFARLDVLFTGVAILLWSGAMLAGRSAGTSASGRADRGAPGRAWSRALAGYGLLLGAALAMGAGSGHLRMGIHGFGLAVLGQGVWLAGVAAHLWHPRRRGAGAA